MELHDRSKPSLTLEDKTIVHINSWVSPDGALCELDKRSLLREVLKSNGVNVYQYFKLYKKLSKNSSFYDPGQRVRTRTYVPIYKPVSEGAASTRGSHRNMPCTSTCDGDFTEILIPYTTH